MGTTQLLCRAETRQPEPQRIPVERAPVEERKKLSISKEEFELIKNDSWEYLRGLSLTNEEDWF